MCLTREEMIAILDLAPRAHGVVDWEWVRRELEEAWAFDELWALEGIRMLKEMEHVQ